MVYGFAKQSGGHVGIQSQPGRGTTVRLYLPRSMAASAAKGLSAGRSAAHFGSGLVLVVEDDPDMRVLAIAQLERLGYAVRSAGNGPDALDMVDQNPDAVLLLTDLTLPGGFNGRDIAQEALKRLPHLKVVYMSGYSQEAANLSSRPDAHIRLLQKPYGLSELTEALRYALG
jgi:CheY-like chemotaxis protein